MPDNLLLEDKFARHTLNNLVLVFSALESLALQDQEIHSFGHLLECQEVELPVAGGARLDDQAVVATFLTDLLSRGRVNR